MPEDLKRNILGEEKKGFTGRGIQDASILKISKTAVHWGGR
jgi:hypothetical protein